MTILSYLKSKGVKFPDKWQCNRHTSTTDTPMGGNHCQYCHTVEVRNQALSEFTSILDMEIPEQFETKELPSVEDIQDTILKVDSRYELLGRNKELAQAILSKLRGN